MSPARNPIAMRMVPWTSAGGMAARADDSDTAPATSRPAGIVTPRSVNRRLSRSRAWASRPRNAPSDSLSWCAAAA